MASQNIQNRSFSHSNTFYIYWLHFMVIEHGQPEYPEKIIFPFKHHLYIWLVVWNMTFIFYFIYGISSFPLTNSYFSRWLNHQPDIYIYICCVSLGRWLLLWWSFFWQLILIGTLFVCSDLLHPVIFICHISHIPAHSPETIHRCFMFQLFTSRMFTNQYHLVL